MQKRPSLIFCLMMDAIGMLTYAFPGLGEFGDIFWAPISGLIFFATFGGWKGGFGGIFNFMEEALPFADIIPSFTLMWWYLYMKERNKTSTIISKR